MIIRQQRLALAIVCFVFGLAIVLQLRTQSRLTQAPSTDSSTDLAAIAASLYDSNSALRDEVNTLQTTRFQSALSLDSADPVKLQDELATLNAVNGAQEVNGPGVELTIDANLRPTDLLDLLNEVRNTGAEAISISGQRVVFSTPIGGTQGHLLVNGVEISSPIIVDALGQSDVLNQALARKGGMLSYLRTTYPDATISLDVKGNLTLPAYSKSFPIQPGR